MGWKNQPTRLVSLTDVKVSKKNLVVERINKLEITSDDATVERALALSMLIEELESSDG